MDRNEPIGFIIPDVEKIACRYCVIAEKEHIARYYCSEYPEPEGKPSEVMFDNAPCPKFKKGEDLLPYEIEI